MIFFGRLVGMILLFPIRVLFLPFEAAIKSLRRPADYEELDEDETAVAGGFFAKIGFWAKRVLGWTFLLPLRILQAPFLLLGAGLREGKTELLFLLPALVAIGFFGFVFYQVFAKSDAIEDRYRRGARQAINDGNVNLAKTYFNRVVSGSKLTERDRLQWAIILLTTGETDRAQQILDQLAPDAQTGYAPAHWMKAQALRAQLGKAKYSSTLNNLRHHLESSPDNIVEIDRAWADYYLAVGQPDKALGYLQAASESNPQMLLIIAILYEKAGRTWQRDRALKKAEITFRELVEKDPLNTKNRITLANVFARMKRYNEAEQVLLTGLKLQPDPVIHRATADFYVMGYDEAVKDGKDFGEQFGFLQRALSLDENYGPVFYAVALTLPEPIHRSGRRNNKNGTYGGGGGR